MYNRGAFIFYEDAVKENDILLRSTALDSEYELQVTKIISY